MPTLQLAFQRNSTTGQIIFDSEGYPLYDDTLNAGANTYGDLQTRIADEILGSPTTAQIKEAIQSAIDLYDSTSFWFNNMRLYGADANFETVQGQEFYSSSDCVVLGHYAHISNVLVLAFANRYPLVNRPYQWIDDVSVSTTWQGLPTDFAWQAGSLRLYPVPNGGYPLIVDGTMRVRTMVDDADYSIWTNEAEALIRYEAKRLLFLHIIRDPQQAQLMEIEINGAETGNRRGVLSSLQRETMRRTGGPGRIRPARGYL